MQICGVLQQKNFEQNQNHQDQMPQEYPLNFQSYKSKQVQTLISSQNTGSENHVSSTTVSGPLGLRLNATVTIEDVRTTLLTDDSLLHDCRTFTVPFTAGSISST